MTLGKFEPVQLAILGHIIKMHEVVVWRAVQNMSEFLFISGYLLPDSVEIIFDKIFEQIFVFGTCQSLLFELLGVDIFIFVDEQMVDIDYLVFMSLF